LQSKRTALIYTALHCNTLQRTAAHCNTLHRTAAHCNTLQHTDAQYNWQCNVVDIELKMDRADAHQAAAGT